MIKCSAPRCKADTVSCRYLTKIIPSILQTVMLLSALGVSDEKLLAKQERFLEDVSMLCVDPEIALRFLYANDLVDLAEDLVDHGLSGEVLAAVKKLQRRELEACLKKQRPGASQVLNLMPR